ncbi:DUF6520 family protein [Flagellimonas lutimaris]|uniref:DUF6520 family protein n=1 Tax=Flagellimonas lutimaris TaxID=475082 RepID=UPI003F5CCB16
MKSKFLKLVLPAFALLLAVGLAFATEEKPVVQQAHYLHPINGWQTVNVEDACFTGSNMACKYDIYQLYAEESESSQALYKN